MEMSDTAIEAVPQSRPAQDEPPPTLGSDIDDTPALRTTIGQHFRDLRLKSGISQEAAAKGIGLSRPHLSNVESGRSRSSWQGLQLIAGYYKVDLASLARAAAARLRDLKTERGLPRNDERGQKLEPLTNVVQTYVSNLSNFDQLFMNGVSDALRRLPEAKRLAVLKEFADILKREHDRLRDRL